ncbi:hypothetical protein CBR_g49912 [Chara braunii]|uniref:HAT C-terminal dimerisation domain-containing protein n=1 Tax=Chara braunii TaxID=69332 RepID=A0A388JPF9_CHABU|nr:hypothetical protein CBR_g49912 [Chara braunii]|eukprot:GBG59648.1 hypothetical protein CBR_g49912 [Chara braunii]
MRRFHAHIGDWGDRLVLDAEAEDCQGDQETHHCAAWWFAHGTAHPELRAISNRVMHMWTPASPAEGNWAAHERIQTAKWSKLGFAKLTQLVEITTNLKLASCRQQGGGYVLPWVMDGVDSDRRQQDEDEDDGDPEPEVWEARPVGTFSDREIRRQIEVFRKDDTSRPCDVSAVFRDRAATLLPFDHVPPPPSRGVEEGFAAVDQDEDYDWTDAEDVVGGTDRTAEQVYFTYGAGLDGHALRTSVITDDVAGGAQVDADCIQDLRFDPSHHSRERSEQLRRSQRVVEHSGPASKQPHDIPVVEGTPSQSGPAQATTSDLRTSNLDIAGSHGDSPVLQCRVGDRAEYRTDVREREETVEERDARLDREEEAQLQSMPRWDGREELDVGGGGQAEVRCEGGDVRGLEIVGADSRVESSDDSEECEATEAIVHDVIVGICTGGTDGGIHGGEEEMVDEGSVPLAHDATHVEEELVDEGSVPLDDDTAHVEEGAAIHAGHNAPSVRDGGTGGHVEEEGAAVDMSLAVIVRTPSMRDVETGGHVDSGRPVSFFVGGYSGEMPRWDGGEPGKCTPTPLLERLGTEDPFPFTGGQPSPPAWAPVSPRWTGSSQSDIRERDALDRQAAMFSSGVASSHVQPPRHPLSRALHQGPALATGRPPTGGRGNERGSSSSHRGGVFGGWSS